MNPECYYTPNEILHLVKGQFPDVIGLDFKRSIEEQLYNFADRIKNSVPRTILDDTLPREEALRLTEMVSKAHRRLQISLATREASWPMWLKNSLHNYEAILHGTPIDEVPWPHTDKPVVIVGGGASLEQTAPQLAEHREQYAVIAIWHALHRLVACGITPDAVIHIDKLAPTGMQDVSLPDTVPVILVPTSHRNFRKSFAAHPVYYMLTRENEAHSQWAEFLGREVHKPAFGTVAATAIRAALYLGHRQIILCGVDLCFPDKASFEAYGLKPETIIETPNMKGETCITVQNFLLYREVLQNLAAEEQANAEFYTLSTDGLDIPGFAPWEWAL